MYTCWKCREKHQDDIGQCPSCGAVRPIDEDPDTTLTVKESVRDESAGVSVPDHRVLLTTELSLKIGDDMIVVPLDRRVLFGRGVNLDSNVVFVDLDSYRGYNLGVSRKHADLYRMGTNRLILVDLGSKNGTRVNGERLTPFKACTINHNDHVFLGDLGLTVQFASVSLPAASAT